MVLFGRICPYCKEKVKKDALVCRYCHKELEPTDDSQVAAPTGILAGVLGLAAGVAMALAFGYYRERKRWEEDITRHSDMEFEEP